MKKIIRRRKSNFFLLKAVVKAAVVVTAFICCFWAYKDTMEYPEVYSTVECYHLRSSVNKDDPEAVERLSVLVDSRIVPWQGPAVARLWRERWQEELPADTMPPDLFIRRLKNIF